MTFDTRKLHRVGVRARDLYRVTTCFVRALPDFVIIGGQKCGTSALYYYLIEHQDVVSARRKETHFFDTRKHKLGHMLYRASFPIRANLRRTTEANGRQI